MKKTVSLFTLSIATSFILNDSFAVESDKQELEEIVITSHLLSDSGLAQSVTVLSGEKLAGQLESSLGDTVANEAGVRSASFGGSVGRPVIHGLGGARVKTTEDRIDTLDVSVSSADHAVAIEPFIANKITILKGASTLLYGSGAIGGVVDVETGRIPNKMPQKLNGKVELRVDDDADARTAAARLDGHLSNAIAWHFDAFTKQADDYGISGDAESEPLKESEALQDAEAQLFEESHDESGSATLLGSRYAIDGGAIGASVIGDAGFVGAAISVLGSEYGLVGGHEHDEEEIEESGSSLHQALSHIEDDEAPGIIELKQTRIDLEGELSAPFQGIEKLNVRVGINDYQHKEIEANGEIGTVFNNDAWEGRIELSHEPIAHFKGAFGLQLGRRDFSALGEEAFVPAVVTDNLGLFWVGQQDIQMLSIEAGVRIEAVEHTLSESQLSSLEFANQSASLGFIWSIFDNASLSMLFDYTERAPAVEELYSFGPHLATQTFEVGNSALKEEAALGVNVGFHYHSDLLDVQAALYKTNFSDFIYQQNSGLVAEGFPVFDYAQDDAKFTGFDFEAALHLAEVLGGDLDISMSFDTLNAAINQGDNLPRIPADRYGLGLVWDNADWRLALNLKQVSKQNQLAIFELPSESYSDVSLRITRRLILGDKELKLFIHGRNLSDQEQREHVSFVKDVAPAPGRRIEAGLRFLF